MADFIQLRKDDIKTTSVLYFPIRLFFLETMNMSSQYF
ncbi:Uncharacterised protein [Streptococcus pneumoniae]|nr:Uncharacterised protein [Streptococcus pneumoniae]